MIFKETKLNNVFIIEIEKKEDHRGFFSRTWCKREFEGHGLKPEMVQSNIAFSKKRGTLRGLHYQMAPFEEDKLVRCIKGSIYDVIIDLRPDYPTYKQWLGVELDGENYKMIYVPGGFAHGYLTLTDNTEVFYQVSQFYFPGSEKGIRYNDPTFNIAWPEIDNLVISDKDRNFPNYSL
ncbi:MAG: dTDP-4-dehydrorhamnose 3,5-epimerase [Thermodesulfobacteriota bacterium]